MSVGKPADTDAAYNENETIRFAQACDYLKMSDKTLRRRLKESDGLVVHDKLPLIHYHQQGRGSIRFKRYRLDEYLEGLQPVAVIKPARKQRQPKTAKIATAPQHTDDCGLPSWA